MDKLNLLPCPFCGGEVRIESNRDRHRIFAAHDEDCVFDADEHALMYPAQPGYLVEIAEVWNRRAAPSSSTSENNPYAAPSWDHEMTPSELEGEASADELPPLPDPDHALDCGMQPFYRPDQVYAYAHSAVIAERARKGGPMECRSDDPGAWSECQMRTIEAYEAIRRPRAAIQAAAPAEAPTDPVVEANRKLLLERSHVGMKKYGTTLAAAGLSRAQLAQHALEEALDLANYLQTIIQSEAAATPEQSDTKGQA